jgi:hypothetical protein
MSRHDWEKHVEDAKIDVAVWKTMERDALRDLIKADKAVERMPGDKAAADELERQSERFMEIGKGRIAAEGRLSSASIVLDQGWY